MTWWCATRNAKLGNCGDFDFLVLLVQFGCLMWILMLLRDCFSVNICNSMRLMVSGGCGDMTEVTLGSKGSKGPKGRRSKNSDAMIMWSEEWRIMRNTMNCPCYRVMQEKRPCNRCLWLFRRMPHVQDMSCVSQNCQFVRYRLLLVVVIKKQDVW